MRFALFAPLIAPLAALLATPLAAQEVARVAGPPGPVTTLSLALRLYDLAAQEGDAAGMAVAARLADGIHLREAGSWKKESGKFTGPRGSEALIAPPVTPDLLFSGAAISGALLMAEEDEALGDLLYELPPVAIRGGVSQVSTGLAGQSRDSWTIPFAGLSPAEIAVFPASEPPAGADASAADTAVPQLLWSVEDASGGVLCPLRPVAATVCSFTPGENGFYRVVIGNPASSAGRYMLVVN